MITKQVYLKELTVDAAKLAPLSEIGPDVVFAFGSVGAFQAPGFGKALKDAFPKSIVIGCSSEGEIADKGVHDNGCVLTAAKFSKAKIKPAQAALASTEASRGAGKEIGGTLKAPDLKAIMVFSVG